MPEFKKLTDFVTYKDFFDAMDKVTHFSYEISNDSIIIFYNFDTQSDSKKLLELESNHLREIIFTISTKRSFSITTPFGFRLTQYKQMINYDYIAQLVVDISRTPIEFRGDLNGS